MVKEDEKDKDLLKMNIGGIQPGQEVTVRLQIIRLLDIEAGAYCLRIPMTYFIKYENAAQVNLAVPGSKVDSPDTNTYDFRVEINSLEDLTYVSVPSHSKVTTVKKDKLNQAVIEKINANVADIKKDIVIYYQAKRMDRP